MGIRIDCPHCGKPSMAPHEQAGKRARCSACEGIMRIPVPEATLSSARPSPPANSDAFTPYSVPNKAPIIVTAPSVTSRQRRRRRSALESALGAVVMLSVSIGGMAAGYVVLDKLGVLDRFKDKAVASQPVEQAHAAPRRQKRVLILPPTTIVEVPEQQPETIEVVPTSQTIVLPKTLNLPNNLDLDVVTLLEIPTATGFSITSVDDRLVLKGKTLRWHAVPETSEPIAGLTIRDGKLIFRWLTDAPDGGIAAVHNSILRIERPAGTETLAMRMPVFVDPIKLDFKKPVLRVTCGCDHPPPFDSIRLTILAGHDFPAFKTTGDNLSSMKVRSETIAMFNMPSSAEGVGIKFTMRKRGRTVGIDLHTRYRLPSNYEGSLTFSNGSKKRKEIENLMNLANNASLAMSNLQRDVLRRESELRRCQSMSTRRYIGRIIATDPSLVAEKNNCIRNAERALRNASADVLQASKLIVDLPAIKTELQATEHISSLVESIIAAHGFTHRFYFVVDGVEVDLVVSK